MKPRQLALAVLVGMMLFATAVWLLRDLPERPESKVSTHDAASADFVGSSECRACHAREYAAWAGSQHARAMQYATELTVQGDFGDAKFTFDGVSSRFTRRDGRFIVGTDGPDGQLADFEVRYTFGVEPLQQYLVELPGGRLQALAVSWDTRPAEQGGQRWFRLYPDQSIDHRDELHWTRRAHNWNFMCADCHSTAVTKGYDAERDHYATRYEEVSVGCEACHGPGSAHVAWAATSPVAPDASKGLAVRFDERRGVSWAIDATTGSATRSHANTGDGEIDVCAQCHARRAQIAAGHRAGQPLLDHYLPSLLVPPLYHADGQQREEVFIWGSWLQSRMHLAGVTCSNCHDSHTQELRAEGNALCAQCHASGKYDAPSHHHHPPGTAGTQCVNCHMPQQTYMVIDLRRDHSMRVPRPDLTASIGVPNACNACHTEEEARWAANALHDWLGRDARGSLDFAEQFHAAEIGRPGAASALAVIANDPGNPPVVRASAVERMALAGSSDAEAARRAARDWQPLLRLAAVQLAERLPPAEQSSVLVPLLTDPLRAVRIEAARALADQQAMLGSRQRAAWQDAADEYLETLALTADRPEARVGLGTFLARMGRMEDAQAAFAQAIALDPDFVPAYLNAADAWRAQGRDDAALAMLEQGLARAPESAPLHHALGLALVRQGDRDQALKALARASQLAPSAVRYTYVYAVALNSEGQATEAMRVLERALGRWPDDRDLLHALAAMQREAGQTEAARRTAERLLRAQPGDAAGRAPLQQLQ